MNTILTILLIFILTTLLNILHPYLSDTLAACLTTLTMEM